MLQDTLSGGFLMQKLILQHIFSRKNHVFELRSIFWKSHKFFIFVHKLLYYYYNFFLLL